MIMKKNMGIGFLVVFFATVWAGAALAQQPPLTLRQAVDLALKKNPELQVSEDQAKATHAQVGEARSGWFPRFDVSQGFTRGNNPIYVFGSLLTQRQFTAANFNLSQLNAPTPLDNFQTRIAGQISVFDSGRTYLREKGAKKMATAADYQTAQARQDLILRVVRAYYGVIVAQEDLKAAQEAVHSAQANEKRVRTMQKAGLVVTSDLLSAEVFQARMKDREIRAKNAVEVAQLNLGREMGMTSGSMPQVVGKLQRPEAPALGVADWEKIALSERPALRAAEMQLQATKDNRKLAKADYGPQIGLFADLERDAETLGGPSGTNWTAGAQLDWNLFDGGARRARLARASAQQHAARHQLEWLRSGVQLQVRQAFLDAQAAEQRAAAAHDAVKQAAESLRIIQNRYQAGLVTITELLRAQTAQLDARTGYLAALHDWQVARAQLDLAAGRLTVQSDLLSQGGTQ